VNGFAHRLHRLAGVNHEVGDIGDTDDRRKLIARLPAEGEIVVEEAFGVAMARFGKLFASFSREELATLTVLLNRVREKVVPAQEENDSYMPMPASTRIG